MYKTKMDAIVKFDNDLLSVRDFLQVMIADKLNDLNLGHFISFPIQEDRDLVTQELYKRIKDAISIIADKKGKSWLQDFWGE